MLILLYFCAVVAARQYFYVGGNYTLDSDGEHIYTDQMYVERLLPANITQPYPLVFIHGQGQTGTNWLNKPDGTPGWTDYFLAHGYELYLIDQTSRGRSPWQEQNGPLKTYSAEYLQKSFTAPENYNSSVHSKLHTQWPGTGVMGDPYFDAYYASTVPFVSDAVAQQEAMRGAGAALLDRIGRKVILVAHSQGGIMGWIWGDQRPKLVHSIVSIEPSGPPFQGRDYGLTNIPIAYGPGWNSSGVKVIPATNENQTDCILQRDPQELLNLRQIPVLLITSETSYHTPYDYCTVQYLQQAGVHTQHLQLAEEGIHGNGHMMFLEKNSDDIAALIHQQLS